MFLINIIQKDVPEFLANLHLSEYKALFEAEGYLFAKDVDNLLHLTESDLLKMGITKRGLWVWSGSGSNVCSEGRSIERTELKGEAGKE